MSNTSTSSVRAKMKLIPELRFPEFEKDGEWEDKVLSDIADRITDKVGNQKLTTVSISAGLGFISQVEKFSRDISGKQYKNYIFLKRGEFAFNKGNSKRFPQGCIYKLKEFDEAAVPNAFICFRFKSIVIPDFYQGYFDNNYHGKQLLKFITSGARMDGLLNISPVDFFNINLPTPKSLSEQQKIASCLSSLDELIAAHSDKLDALKDHKKGLMQNLFPHPSTGSGPGQKVPNYRFPEFEKDGEWEEKELSEVAEIVTGNTPSTKESKYYGGEIMFVSPADISKNKYVKETKTTLTSIGFSKTRHIKANSVLFVCIGSTIGKVAQNKLTCATNQQINSLMPNKETSSDFLYSNLEQNSTKIAELAGNQAVPIINKSLFSSVKLLFPFKFKEQQKIASCLSSLDNLITEQSEKVEKLQQHKKGLMQGLFPKIKE